jgi:hypothetical protein
MRRNRFPRYQSLPLAAKSGAVPKADPVKEISFPTPSPIFILFLQNFVSCADATCVYGSRDHLFG